MDQEHSTADLRSGLSLLSQTQDQIASSSWLTGIKSVDIQLKSLFLSGRVVGIATRADAEIVALSTHIIATHLISNSSGMLKSIQPVVFTISPPSMQTMISVAGLLQHNLQAQAPQTKLEPTELLNRVQLFQYLSVAGLIESIGDVSTKLHESSSGNPGTEQLTPIILLVQGFSNALADTSRRSGAVQTTALVTNMLRSLTHLSRTHRHLLVLVELDLETRSTGTTVSTDRSAGSTTQVSPSIRRGNDSHMLHSAFTSQQGHKLSLLPPVAPICNALDNGMDVILAVHDAFGKTRAHDKEQAKKGAKGGKTLVIEVLKDRLGDKTGEWCLWVQ